MLALEKNIVEGMVDGKRRRGRPAAGWLDDIKEWTGLTVTNAIRLANDATDGRLSRPHQR